MEREPGDAGAQGLRRWLRILIRKAELGGRHGSFDRRGQSLLQRGRGLLEQCVGLEGVVAETLHDRRQASGDLEGEFFNLLGGGIGQGHEGELILGPRHEEPIGHEAVGMGM